MARQTLIPARAALDQYGRVDGDPDHLPWYSYVVGLFIFALGVIALRRQSVEKKSWGKIEILCLVFSIAVAFVAPIQNIPWDGKLRLINVGYPVSAS